MSNTILRFASKTASLAILMALLYSAQWVSAQVFAHQRESGRKSDDFRERFCRHNEGYIQRNCRRLFGEINEQRDRYGAQWSDERKDHGNQRGWICDK